MPAIPGLHFLRLCRWRGTRFGVKSARLVLDGAMLLVSRSFFDRNLCWPMAGDSVEKQSRPRALPHLTGRIQLCVLAEECPLGRASASCLHRRFTCTNDLPTVPGK